MNKASLNFHLTEHNRKIAYKKLEGKSTEEPGIIFLYEFLMKSRSEVLTKCSFNVD